MRRSIIAFLFAVWVAVSGAYDWSNLTPEKRLGGRMVSAGYLRGKVVVLDCRDYGDKANFSAIRELQQLWACYKTKPFVVVGSHRGSGSPKRMAAILDRLGVTYPVYAEAELKGVSDGATAKTFVIDSTGTLRLYGGSDVRTVSGVVGNAIFSTTNPSAAKQWKRLLDYETVNLPGQAVLRMRSLQAQKDCLEEVRRSCPGDLGRWSAFYEKAKGDNEIKRLAKLVESARLVKDRDPDSKGGQKVTKAGIEKLVSKFESLKESSNPAVVQEAKNAIADLVFAAATLQK